MDSSLDLFTAGIVAAAGLRVISAAQLNNIAVCILDNFVATDDIGIFKAYFSAWYQAAEALIQKAGEQKLLEALTDWESRHNYAKDSARTVRHKALQLHISRIFDNPRWVNFIPFNREYRPEVLEHARLVTVINECCGKPGEVTQEQIDGACTGTVACPHCGRWSSFSIVEPKQAEEQGIEMI